MTVQIIYYSDLLCVWAYVGERRLEEVRARFGTDVEIERRFCSVFGDSKGKIGRGWRDRGGYEGFAAHVRGVAARFDHVRVHPDLWLTTRPASSDSAHLFAKASQLLESRGEVDPGTSATLEASLRTAFFRDCRDIARWDVQADVADALAIPLPAIEAEVRSGAAHAALAKDAQGRDQWDVRGSPTLILDEGRQTLYGNVGYRVIEANIQEMLREPGGDGASWC